MSIASEIALDLDVTWSQARELFAGTLFERAEHRYGTAPRIAAALDTSLRTVKQYRHRRREDEAQPSTPTFNMRRRVLHLLDEGPRTLEEIEEALPVGSDVNYARSAVQSLIEDGLVVEGVDGQLRQPEESFVPWYLRPELHPGSEIETLCESFARLLGTRLTPKADLAAIPALLMTMVHNIPRSSVKDYQAEFTGLVADFDERWTQLQRETASSQDRVLGGGVITIGEIGEPVTPETMARYERKDPRHLAFDDDVAPTYKRYYDEHGRRIHDDPEGDVAVPSPSPVPDPDPSE